MTLMELAAVCALAANGGSKTPAATDCRAVAHDYQAAIVRVGPDVTAPASRDAIARVAYAEAGNQGDSGLAGVIYTVLNRLVDGRFGSTVGSVLDAAGQFEPVTRAHGWRNLPSRSAIEQAHIDTILNLALDGRLPDPTNGARYFQNPTIVAARVAAGRVSPERTHFGGQQPIAVIGAHAFYPGLATQKGEGAPKPSLFVPLQSPGSGPNAPAMTVAPEPNPLFVPVQSAY